MSWRRRIGWLAAVLLGLPVVAAGLFLLLVDVDAYKPAVVRAVKEATGRELVIDGRMKLDVWPEPRITARRVHFANPPGSVGAQMLDVRWIAISPSWLALLSGRIEVGRLILYRPNIALETDAYGVPNWKFEPGAGAAQPDGAAASGFHLAVGRVRIVQGTLSYTNPLTRQTVRAESVDASATVQSFEGPFTIAGRATVNGVPLSVDVDVGGRTTAGHAARLMLQVANGRLEFTGTVGAIAADADLKGKLSVNSGLLTDFLSDILQATAQSAPRFEGPVVGGFGFEGDIELSPLRLSLGDFRLSLGGETATGSLSVEGGAAPSLQARVALPKVDLERWIALLQTPRAFLARPAAAEKPPPDKPAPAAPPTLALFPPEMAVSLELDVGEVQYRQGSLRAVAVKLESRKGVVSVPSLEAVLPGDLVLRAHAVPVGSPSANAKPAADPLLTQGEVTLKGPRLRDTLAWLQVDTSRLPEGRLGAIDLAGRIAATARGIHLADLAVVLDGQKATGSGSLSLGPPLAVSASLQLDRLDLDSYLPVATLPGSAGTELAAPPAGGAAASADGAIVLPPAPPPPDKTLPIVALKARIGKVLFQGETVAGVEADLAAQGSLLTVNALKVADLLGAKADAKGAVADFVRAPRFDLAFNANLPDADRVLDYVGLPRFLNGRIGALAASGQIAGTADVLVVRNATVNLLDSTGHATGALALGRSFRFHFSAFDFRTPDASRVLAVATGKAQDGIGAIDVAGSFRGDGRRAVFDGHLTALGTPMKGRVEATLGKRPSFAVDLRIPGTLDLDRWLGVSPPPPARAGPTAAAAPAGVGAGPASPIVVTPRATSDKPIDLAALRAFDATLKLETSAVAVAALKVLYADLQATLQNGQLRIDKLTGQFFGGAVDFTGTVDATGQALALDLRGSLQGIYLGELLRGSIGRNVYGNEHLMVAMDGKLSILDIGLQGGGATPQQIRDSLNGHGRVSGFVYPGVAAGSLGFASFATGFGSLFSTEMGFGSAVLSGFINHQNAIDGELLLNGTTVTLRNQAVRGNNATAVVNSVNSFSHETTDTVIALDSNGRGAVDYVMTVKGPITAPSITTRSGP